MDYILVQLALELSENKITMAIMSINTTSVAFAQYQWLERDAIFPLMNG